MNTFHIEPNENNIDLLLDVLRNYKSDTFSPDAQVAVRGEEISYRGESYTNVYTVSEKPSDNNTQYIWGYVSWYEWRKAAIACVRKYTGIIIKQ